ncbi:DUF934 domain-containing protein [Methylobrevis albus]|uniref:DUF934 domain-containing protein n=1 Tax=Methylobrevis albus TaxID=2793297 RepID=A0A931I3K5_9HYPH|nr:DUF934 domain-containing protein [Methylobrevis albus]MBH0238829.1 DUF934 domain-containing protein [Methylobrevis albus]
MTTADPTTAAPTGATAPAPARDVWRGTAFQPDDWRPLGDDEAVPAEGKVFLPLARFLAEAGSLAGDNRPLGVTVEPGAKIDDLAPFVDRLAAIALAFPKYNDGRAYSYATLLRSKWGFAGELRAVGNVLIDQIGLMRRVGFDSFEVAHGPTRRLLVEGKDPEVTRYYQPAFRDEPPAGTRPWMRVSPGKK